RAASREEVKALVFDMEVFADESKPRQVEARHVEPERHVETHTRSAPASKPPPLPRPLGSEKKHALEKTPVPSKAAATPTPMNPASHKKLKAKGAQDELPRWLLPAVLIGLGIVVLLVLVLSIGSGERGGTQGS